MLAVPFQLSLTAQYFCCFFMTGVIWLVQLVHYPAFKFVDENKFKEFDIFHSSRITCIVAPVMGIELLTAFILCFSAEPAFIGNFTLVLILWGLTGFVSVPIHNSLTAGYDLKKINQLVLTNWFRTAVWTFRSVFLMYFLTQ